jgi:hypothetical protein
MQGSALVLGEVVALIVSDQIDDCTIRQRRRLVEDETSIFHVGA